MTARALQPGGRFLIDTHVLETLLPRFQERAWNHVGDIDLLESRRWNERAGCAETEWTLVRGAEREVHHSRIRVYSYRELIYLLESVGFTDFEACGGRSRKPFGIGAERLCLVATKG